MTARNRPILVVALTTALLSPAVLAGTGGADAAAQSVQGHGRNTPERTLRDLGKPATHTTETTERTAGAAMPPPAPPQAQGAAQAAAHSSVVQRDVWTRLDADGDGRISAAEGAVDAAFKADFAALDADDDGFVSDTEFRGAAKAAREPARTLGDAGAAAPSSVGTRDAIARLDANADGSVSAAEANADAGFKAGFAAMDRDSDGLVSDAEYRAWVKAERK